MKQINPSEISARLMTLLEESKEKVIIVSPYVKISKWYKLARKLKELTARNIALEIYVREDEDNTATYQDLEQLELPFTKIPHLHSKFYLNERWGILTSMNLLIISEINSLEIGFATENQRDYTQLLDYYYRYILVSAPIANCIGNDRQVTDLEYFARNIIEKLKENRINAWPLIDANTLHITTGWLNYCIWISEGSLWISARMKIPPGFADFSAGIAQTKQKRASTMRPESQSKQDIKDKVLLTMEKLRDISAMDVDLQASSSFGYMKTIGHTRYTVSSLSITDILEGEIISLESSVLGFIKAAEILFSSKATLYQKKK